MKRMGIGLFIGVVLGGAVGQLALGTLSVGIIVGGFIGLAIGYLKDRIEI